MVVCELVDDQLSFDVLGVGLVLRLSSIHRLTCMLVLLHRVLLIQVGLRLLRNRRVVAGVFLLKLLVHLVQVVVVRGPH